MPLTNRPLFLHPRVLWRTDRPILFTAQPGPGADVLEEDAATLFAALEPLIEVLNLGGYELTGAAFSSSADESDTVTYVNFITMVATYNTDTWADLVGVPLPAGANSALALQVEPRIASGYVPPIANTAALTYAMPLQASASRWTSQLNTTAAGWLIHVPDHAVGTLGAAAAALGKSRTNSASWLRKGDIGALVADVAAKIFAGWNAQGGSGMLRMLQPAQWQPQANLGTPTYLAKHLSKRLMYEDGGLRNDLGDLGALPSWRLRDYVGPIAGIFRRTREDYRADLKTMYGEGAFAEALAMHADAFGPDPVIVDIMVLLSLGLMSLKSRDARWYTDPPASSARIGEEPFPVPLEPTWLSTDVTGFYQVVMPVREIELPDDPSDNGNVLSAPRSRRPESATASALDLAFATTFTGVFMLQVNQAGRFLEGQWQGRFPGLETDWDGDGHSETHLVGVTHGTISAQVTSGANTDSPIYEGTLYLPAATNPEDVDIEESIRLEFAPGADDNMHIDVFVGEEPALVFRRQFHVAGGKQVDILRPHLTDRELRNAASECARLLWGSERAPLHSNEIALLAMIAKWIVELVDETGLGGQRSEAMTTICEGLPILMIYFGPEQRAFAQVQLRYLLEKWPYFGGPVGNWFGDEQNYWQGLLEVINRQAAGECPHLLEALGISDADVEAVLSVHHRYEFTHGTISLAVSSSLRKVHATYKSGKAVEAVWDAVKLGTKSLFKAGSLAEFPLDFDVDFVEFTFKKLLPPDPDDPGAEFRPDPDAVGYPTTLRGMQINISGGLSWGLRTEVKSSTIIKTNRELWSPTDWAGPYMIVGAESGIAMLSAEDWLPNPVRFVFNQLGWGHEEGASVGFIFFFRYPQGATIPEVAWAFSPSWVENTGLLLTIVSGGVAAGWLCENIGVDDGFEAFLDSVYECAIGAQGQMPAPVEEEMYSGAALTATNGGFLANASRLHDVGAPSSGSISGYDAVGQFAARNLHAFRRGASHFEVHGHASVDGTDLLNRNLSERRVEYVQRLVATMLGRDFAIHPSRIEGLGLGESVAQDYVEPDDPNAASFRMVEISVNREGLRLTVPVMP